jgi:transducin (beta)-like 1
MNHTGLAFSSAISSSSKDGIVNIWQVPDHPGDMPPPPVKVSYFTREDSADLTAMDWNVDGTLLAIGSYDAMLRIVSPNGSLYFSHPQHMVNSFSHCCPAVIDSCR